MNAGPCKVTSPVPTQDLKLNPDQNIFLYQQCDGFLQKTKTPNPPSTSVDTGSMIYVHRL